MILFLTSSPCDNNVPEGVDLPCILDASNRRWDSKRKTTIFLAGAGRSGFVAKSFAMRLMHLGFYVYVINESIAPPVNDGDIIIIISKSGKSNSITQIVEDSQFGNVKLLAVCGDSESNLAKKADANIVIESVEGDSVNMDDEIKEFISDSEKLIETYINSRSLKTSLG